MRHTWIGMLAAVAVAALAGCSSGHHKATRSRPAANASEPVVYGTEASSPDGKRLAVATADAIKVGPAGGRGPWRTIYESPNGLTTDLYWPTRNLIAFADDNVEVNTIDVRTRRVRLRLASATNFTVSSDGRWIGWTQFGGESEPDAVGIVSITGRECRQVPTPDHASDSYAFFKPGVQRLFFSRQHYDRESETVGSSKIISVALSTLRRARQSVCRA